MRTERYKDSLQHRGRTLTCLGSASRSGRFLQRGLLQRQSLGGGQAGSPLEPRNGAEGCPFSYGGGAVSGAVNSTNSAENAGGRRGGSGCAACVGLQMSIRSMRGMQRCERDERRSNAARRSRGKAMEKTRVRRQKDPNDRVATWRLC
jgi:hypothetical protein